MRQECGWVPTTSHASGSTHTHAADCRCVCCVCAASCVCAARTSCYTQSHTRTPAAQSAAWLLCLCCCKDAPSCKPEGAVADNGQEGLQRYQEIQICSSSRTVVVVAGVSTTAEAGASWRHLRPKTGKHTRVPVLSASCWTQPLQSLSSHTQPTREHTWAVVEEVPGAGSHCAAQGGHHAPRHAPPAWVARHLCIPPEQRHRSHPLCYRADVDGPGWEGQRIGGFSVEG